MQEEQILQSALQHFQQQTGLAAQEINLLKMPKAKQPPEGAVKIEVKGKSYLFLVSVKNELRQHHLPPIISQFESEAEKWLLVCQYISKPNRVMLKEKGINYLDASGNCNIRQNALVVYVNDVPVTPQRQPATGKLWKSAGLRLVFAVLLKPDLINKPQRNISAESMIALGTVGPLLQELEAEGYLKTFEQGSKLENRDALLNRWTENFYGTLRPRLLQGRFRFVTTANSEKWKNSRLDQAWWSGEPAGALLTGYLHPEKFTLYSGLPKTAVMKQLRLVPDANGEVELLKPFWNTETIPTDHEECVPALLVYAELNTSLDSRNRETAHRIKQLFNV